jgi:hypothetical protein
MRSRIHCPLQLRQQIGDGAVQVVRKTPYGPPVMRLRLDPYRLKEHCGGDMAGMGNEWNGHPRADRLVHRVEPPRLFAGPIGEDESACDREQEGDPKNRYSPPGFSHNSI